MTDISLPAGKSLCGPTIYKFCNLELHRNEDEVSREYHWFKHPTPHTFRGSFLTGRINAVLLCSSSLFVHLCLWIHMWLLFCSCLFVIFPSFGKAVFRDCGIFLVSSQVFISFSNTSTVGFRSLSMSHDISM